MNQLFPYYVNTMHSDIRAIKDGWYAMNRVGNLLRGPFSSREECVQSDEPANEINTAGVA